MAILPAVAAALIATPQAGQKTDSVRIQRLVKEASAVKNRHAIELMRLPAVTGTGIGLSKDAPKTPVIEVYVTRELTEQERERFPARLDGVRVEIVNTGEFRALKERSDKEAPDKRPQKDQPAEPQRKKQ